MTKNHQAVRRARAARSQLALVALLAALVLAGCGDESDSPDATEESSVTTPSPTGSGSPDPSSPDPSADDPSADNPSADPSAGESGSADPGTPETVASATTDLIQRLGISEQDVTVVSAEQVTWRDGSLGCPEPGMSYTQALVEGHRVVLEAQGETYTYHSGTTRGGAFLCEDPQPPL